MNRLAVALMIAAAALLANGPLVRPAKAADQPAPATAPPSAPAMAGPQSERVVSLLLALEALRAAPAVLEPSDA